MTLMRWEPTNELTTIQNEMNRLFNGLFDRSNGTTSRVGASHNWFPAMDLVETADHYVLRADLPGISDEDVSVQLEENVLIVSGERKPANEQGTDGYYRIERAFGRFSRTLTLPRGVDPDAVQAHFDRGVLEVTIPKPEQKKPKHVQITLGRWAQENDIIESKAKASQDDNHQLAGASN